jgi:signal recognition particle subunit SRP19
MSEKQLLEAIALKIQEIKPELVPTPPYTYPTTSTTESAAPAPSGQAKPSAKGKAPASKSANTKTTTPKGKGGRPLPLAPQPEPALATRLSPYSPLISTNMLIDTVKAGMTAQAPEGAGAVPAGAQKGKKKVIRVRG